MTKTFTESQLVDAIEGAFAAAQSTAKAFLEKHGDQWGACGFAWVVVKPGNSKLAKILKTKYGAGKHYDGGVSVWAPGAAYTQNMDMKEEAAYAFAEHLRTTLGLTYAQVYAGSRMD